MKLRKFALLAATILATATALVGASCDEPNDGPGTGNDGKTTFISLDKEKLSLTLGDESVLVANYLKLAGKVLVFTSSNPSIVKVDAEGNLIALAEGKATITATYAGLSDTCEVTVGLNGNLPMLQFPYVPDTDVQTLAVWASLDLNGEVLFNQNVYTDATFTYALSDSTVGTIENGVFTPSKVGTTDITVTGTWRGVAYDTLTTTVTVNVIEK